MGYFISSIFFGGLIIAAIVAMQANPKWQAKLMLIPSIIGFFAYFILAATIDSIDWGSFIIIIILGAIVLICSILFFMGLLFFCLKTHAATKANEQLDFLNFQLKDQLEIRRANQSKTPQP